MSFADKVKNSRSELIYLVRGKDQGKQCWHYVLVEKLKLPVFLEKVKGGTLDVADYGRVLYSGWGNDPPKDIEDKLDAEFK